MARRTSKKETIQVFIVSWFPIYASEASTIMCLSRDHAARISAEVAQSFTAYPGHDPKLHIDRQERRVTS